MLHLYSDLREPCKIMIGVYAHALGLKWCYECFGTFFSAPYATLYRYCTHVFVFAVNRHNSRIGCTLHYRAKMICACAIRFAVLQDLRKPLYGDF